MNVPGTAIIGGHVLASTARYAVAVALMLAVGYGIGFRAHATAGGALAAAGILLLFAFAVSWLRGFAANQPVTPATEAVRALLLGQPAGGHLVPALAWTGGIAVVSMGAAAALFRRGTR